MAQESRRAAIAKNLKNALPAHPPLEKVGDAVDTAISIGIERHFEAPLLEGEPELYKWYRITIPEGIAGDGSGYFIYIKKGSKITNYSEMPGSFMISSTIAGMSPLSVLTVKSFAFS